MCRVAIGCGACRNGICSIEMDALSCAMSEGTHRVLDTVHRLRAKFNVM